MPAKRPRRATKLAETCDFEFAADEQCQMPRDHSAESQPLWRLVMSGVEANKIAAIDELATGLPAGVEACVTLCALPMKSQQTKSFDGPDRRHLALRSKPNFKNGFADAQELVRQD